MASQRRLHVISSHVCSAASLGQSSHLLSEPTAATPALGRKLQSQYDYIVVGAGSAGCVAASRLSEDPSVSVLLIEAGSSNQQFRVRSPTIPLLGLQNSDIDYAYRTTPQATPVAEDRVHHWPRGKCLGGSSSINFMAYVRGDPRNYDDWAQQGCSGWSYEEVLPFFKKSENFVGKDLGPSHGRGGPLTVSQLEDADFSTRALGERFVDSCGTVGLPKIDYNGPVQTGASLLQHTVDKGVRCDTASAFLYGTGALQRSNLTVLIDSNATKVLVDSSKRATGVVLQGKSGPSQTVNASKEIIVSCGTVGTPQLLMLSGLGPASHLQEHGIECVQDLPVGENLQDHLFVGLGYKVKPGKQPFSPLRPLTGGVITGLAQHFLYGTGNLSQPPGHGTAFYHSGIPGHDASRGNDIQLCFSGFGGTTADNVVKNCGLEPPGPESVAASIDSIVFLPIILLPQSIGTVRLASRDPKKHPIIDPKYFSHPRDLDVFVEACKKCREIARSPPLKDVLVEDFELSDDTQPIPHPKESDAYLRELLQRMACTGYHPVGTAKMGAGDDATAVVDPELRVRGVTGLRVADASVMPTIISGNTNATSIMIGERCATFIQTRR